MITKTLQSSKGSCFVSKMSLGYERMEVKIALTCFLLLTLCLLPTSRGSAEPEQNELRCQWTASMYFSSEIRLIIWLNASKCTVNSDNGKLDRGWKFRNLAKKLVIKSSDTYVKIWTWKFARVWTELLYLIFRGKYAGYAESMKNAFQLVRRKWVKKFLITRLSVSFIP